MKWSDRKRSRKVELCSPYAQNGPSIFAINWIMAWRSRFRCSIVPGMKWNGWIKKVELRWDQALKNDQLIWPKAITAAHAVLTFCTEWIFYFRHQLDNDVKESVAMSYCARDEVEWRYVKSRVEVRSGNKKWSIDLTESDHGSSRSAHLLNRMKLLFSQRLGR